MITFIGRWARVVVLVIFYLLPFTSHLSIQAQRYVGGDISVLLKYERQHATYLDKDGAAITDVLDFLKQQGWNTMRVRLFVDPSNDKDKNVVQDLEYVTQLGKRIKKYTRILKLNEIIEHDPYEYCKISRGHSKPRTPLTEQELLKMRKVQLIDKLDRVRDLFIFAAYTGMAYADVQRFDFKKMTHKIGRLYYIDSERLKTGTEFYTPILKPAMDVLKKYDFKLPKITNQKANDYLHVIEVQCGFKKSLTFHLARHSFATLALAHDVPIEDISRMLGHSDIKTTQIYCKILKTTVQRHSEVLASSIL